MRSHLAKIIYKKYPSMLRRLGRNRAIVAIARLLVEIIHTMLFRGQEFIDNLNTSSITHIFYSTEPTLWAVFMHLPIS